MTSTRLVANARMYSAVTDVASIPLLVASAGHRPGDADRQACAPPLVGAGQERDGTSRSWTTFVLDGFAEVRARRTMT